MKSDTVLNLTAYATMQFHHTTVNQLRYRQEAAVRLKPAFYDLIKFITDLSGNAWRPNLTYEPFRISDGTVSDFNAGDCLKAPRDP